MLTKTVSVLLVATLAAAAMSCPFCKIKDHGRFIGQAELIGNGSAYTWLDIDKDGKPFAYGVSLTESALDGLTDEVDKYGMGPEWRLKLPKEASMFPIDHLAIDWEPKGHIPAGVYDVPHFDFHFYLLDVATRQSILPEPELLKKCEVPLGAGTPAGYVMAPGSAVPWMGAHWVNMKAAELNGSPFTSTFLYGSWDGKLAFIEPMITKAYFETKSEQTFDIPVPASSWKPGLYPSKYTVRWDKVRKEYQVILHDFVQVKS